MLFFEAVDTLSKSNNKARLEKTCTTIWLMQNIQLKNEKMDAEVG